ncbi:DegT/DnrJ/EryC1/StrS family aminotransferase [Streptomyces sp. 1114.5]|uniref:DegT/DnrJ/EryC1/StrS family aminotransferase n=1 Tax=Streptomyces sp. 1114.5 TaxID=1938830 RepID=UPI00217D38B6|nr:DegT/DnrJ/EryC1/StrS family aminotransferase [Streptomyces sp. 1114.5]
MRERRPGSARSARRRPERQGRETAAGNGQPDSPPWGPSAPGAPPGASASRNPSPSPAAKEASSPPPTGRIYERALTLGHHPARLADELALPELKPLADIGAAYKYRMPALSAVIARQQLRSLPDRMRAAEQHLATLRQALEEYDAPIAWPEIGELSVRGWYGTPLTINVRVPDPKTLHEKCRAAGIPVRAQYEDWTQTPLLQRLDLAARCGSRCPKLVAVSRRLADHGHTVPQGLFDRLAWP